MDPTKRFSSRVENYAKYRPTYPRAVLDLLVAECGLTGDSVVADVGSGTGLLSELFLKNGNRVFGIEPNREMREAGERLLKDYARFTSVAATAESTTLGDGSVDFVTAGQAFHWFERGRARAEFARILKPEGWVVLVWNERGTDATPFLASYERLLLAYGTDYEAVTHKKIDAGVIGAFFEPGAFEFEVFENRQVFNLDALRGRLLSSSFVPERGQPDHEAMMDELGAIFDAHQENGKVTFEYDTKVYYGQLTPDR
jgi:SAM-dependent methyltransferase